YYSLFTEFVCHSHVASKLDSLPVMARDSINCLQEVPWRINRWLYDIIVECEKRAHPLIPSSETIPMPPPPDWEDKDAKRKWAQEAAFIHRARNRQSGHRIGLESTLRVAGMVLDEKTIYFPWNCDFRGRMYPIPNWLSPQGPDWSRALLEFSEGMPVDPQALGWLLVNVANCYGVDKVPFEARIAWSEDHWDDIMACGKDPFATAFWHQADDPWQFLAAAHDLWLMETSDGDEYSSHIPVSFDGTCNGIQHYAAITRDEVCAKAVNVIPSDGPQDIYALVAEDVRKRLDIETISADTFKCSIFERPVADMAKTWLDWGITRKIAKRPVMIFPYGGTQFAMREYITEHYEEATMGGKARPWVGDMTRAASVFLTTRLHESLSSRVGRAQAAMNWLRECADIISLQGKHMEWITPSGFVVRQNYRRTKIHEIVTCECGKLTLHVGVPEGTAPDKRAARQGFPPNWIHSIDSTHAQMVIAKCYKAGIHDFVTVHDSYSCHAANADRMRKIIREQFVALHRNNLMDDIWKQMQKLSESPLPEPPERGSLDVEEAAKSRYLFA
ncbi:MAG: hypothetical protein KKF27_20795, partial [Gammaproteobacteria bacterium]|nr:hypothetical protein [Gammaproteobacteria bacterium]